MKIKYDTSNFLVYNYFTDSIMYAIETEVYTNGDGTADFHFKLAGNSGEVYELSFQNMSNENTIDDFGISFLGEL
jgi:hypothetical protein